MFCVQNKLLYLLLKLKSGKVMKREIFRTIIAENQEIVMRIALNVRPFDFEPKGNYVFVGVRQAGKSYLLFQRIQQLISQGHSIEEIVYINFDDERIALMTADDFDLIIQAYQSMFNHKPIFFFDEIQNVEHWEKFARRLTNEKYQVYITGSNAKMLSRDIATTLGGRFWTQNVYPYSFNEYLNASGLVLEKNWQYGRRQVEIFKQFDEFFRFGGFPELIDVVSKRAWLNNIFSKIFFSDIVVRNGVRNESALRLTVSRLAESIKQPTSYNRLMRLVKSVGVPVTTATIIDFVRYMRESCMLFSLENFASKFVEKESVKKHYFVDNGLLNIFLTGPNIMSSLLENLCAIHLYRKYGESLYYYNCNIEVDFYLPEQNVALQACYTLSDNETAKREIDAIEKLHSFRSLSRAYIITYDDDTEIKSKSGLMISVLPVWKWLLL